MENLISKLKYFVSYRNNSSYKYVLALALVWCFDGKRVYSFEELFRFVVSFYFNITVRYKIKDKSSGLSKVPYNIYKYAGEKNLSYLDEKDFMFLCAQNIRDFFPCPLMCFDPEKSLSCFEGKNSFFKYSIKNSSIEITSEFYDLLNNKNMQDIIKDVIILSLINFLEKYNNIPNMYGKILGNLPKRSLFAYKKLFKDKCSPLYSDICYICGEKLGADISIDHFIPFSYVCCDELWNLIPVHKNCNSIKNDRILSKEKFKKLISRNYKLYSLQETDSYFSLLKNELFDKYPTFDSLYLKMNGFYESCKSCGYREMIF